MKEFSDSNPSPSLMAYKDLTKTHEALDQILLKQNANIIVAEISNQVVACMVLANLPSLVHGSRIVLIMDLLIIKKEFRRKGIGKMMVDHTIKMAKKLDAYKVLLVTSNDNEEAKSLYKSRNFVVNGVAFAYYI